MNKGTRGVSRFVWLSQQSRAICGVNRLDWLSHQSRAIPEVVPRGARQNAVQPATQAMLKQRRDQRIKRDSPAGKDKCNQQRLRPSVVCNQRRLRPDLYILTTMRQTPIDFFLFRQHRQPATLAFQKLSGEHYLFLFMQMNIRRFNWLGQDHDV